MAFWLCVSGLLRSMILLTVNGHEFDIILHYAIKICKDSVFKLLQWFLSKPANMLLQNKSVFLKTHQKDLHLVDSMWTFWTHKIIGLVFAIKECFPQFLLWSNKVGTIVREECSDASTSSKNHPKACINESVSNECVTLPTGNVF